MENIKTYNDTELRLLMLAVFGKPKRKKKRKERNNDNA